MHTYFANFGDSVIFKGKRGNRNEVVTTYKSLQCASCFPLRLNDSFAFKQHNNTDKKDSWQKAIFEL
jgi:hypothetical protein